MNVLFFDECMNVLLTYDKNAKNIKGYFNVLYLCHNG